LFFAKNRRFNVFFIDSLRTEGKRGKNSPFRPRLSSSAKIGHVGVYFAKTGCEIEAGFTDIFEIVGRHLGWASGVFCLAFAPDDAYKFCIQKRKWLKPFVMAQPSLFFPYFDFTLMNVYMNTGIK